MIHLSIIVHAVFTSPFDIPEWLTKLTQFYQRTLRNQFTCSLLFFVLHLLHLRRSTQLLSLCVNVVAGILFLLCLFRLFCCARAVYCVQYSFKDNAYRLPELISSTIVYHIMDFHFECLRFLQLHVSYAFPPSMCLCKCVPVFGGNDFIYYGTPLL